MKIFNFLPLLCVSGCLVAATATSSSIGTIKSPGEFRVDGSVIRGNSTVFDGNVIETRTATSVIQLAGAQITLSGQSRVKVFRDHTVIEDGNGLITDTGKHVIEAGSLRIVPASNESVVRVKMSGPRDVAVSAGSGTAEVRNLSGILVATLRPGTALAFDAAAGAAAAATLTGVLSAKGSAFLLTDTTANITVELRGADLAKYTGKPVRVTGSIMKNSTAAAGASQVIHVTAIDVISSAKKSAAAAGAAGTAAGGAAAGGAAAGAAAAGISTAATVAIVGGVAVAGTVAGVAATSNDSGSSSVSRQ